MRLRYASALMTRFAQRLLHKPWFAVLLLTVAMFRGLLPPGHMASVDASGALTLKMCSGYVTVIPLDGSPPSDTRDPPGLEQGDACPFSAAASDMAPGPAWIAPALVVQTRAPSPRSLSHLAPLGASRSAHLPRGPPHQHA
jgi:hypothetical protein